MSIVRRFIGIDPGIDTCGIAVYSISDDGKNELRLFSGECYEVLKMLEQSANVALVVIEDVNENTHIWGGKFSTKDSDGKKGGIGQSLGKTKGAQLIIEQCCAALGFPTRLVSVDIRRTIPPARKKDVGPFLQAYPYPTKTTAEQFEYLLGVWGVNLIHVPKSPFGTEHSRDAATLLQPIFIDGR